MPRYIDANKLKNRILEERAKIAITVVERYSFDTPVASTIGCAMRGGIRKALRCMEQTPTADVVPRAEVELYKRQVNELEDELATTYDKLENAKADVAREIFGELEAVLFGMRDEDSREPMLCVYLQEFEDLKKKYAGGEADA